VLEQSFGGKFVLSGGSPVNEGGLTTLSADGRPGDLACVLFSLLPLIGYRLSDRAAFWNWALGVYGVAHIADASSFVVRQHSKARVGPAYVGVAAGIAQVLVATLGSAFVAEATYLLSLVGQLGGAAMGFVFLIWDRGPRS